MRSWVATLGMAGDTMIVSGLAKVGRDRSAHVHRDRAAWMEAAAGCRICQIWRAAWQTAPPLVRADPRQARDEMPGVGMPRRSKKLRSRRLLDQAASIHDTEPVGQRSVHTQIVGHEQNGRSDLLLKLPDHAQHL